MDSIAIYLCSSDDDSENEVSMAIQRKRLRDKSNIFEITSNTFLKLFRLSKESFSYVLEEIKDELRPMHRSTAIPPMIKLAAALRFYAQGGYQLSVGEDLFIGLSQQSISEVLNEVSEAIENKICPKWIKLEMSPNEKKEAKRYFYQKYGIPNVVGSIDGTHIQLIRPHENENLFFNRKLKHSINAMVICDHKMTIKSVNGRFGGSSHDSFVWSLSQERVYFQDCHSKGEQNWLLGDAGYPLEPWLLTPYRVAPDGSAEAKYNNIHSKARSIIERVFGLLKSRFRCLLAARELHYSPAKAIKILNVCCALHNICLAYNVTFEDIVSCDNTMHDEIDQINLDHSNNSLSNDANQIRNQIRDIL